MNHKPKPFDYSLPKWPQMVVTGETVSVERAKDIIFRTDRFFSDFDEFAGGNDRAFTKYFQEISGISEIRTRVFSQYESGIRRYQALHEIESQLMERIGFIRAEYLTNDWASSCFAWGPHGWIHPDGKIGYSDNIGKWPSVEEVYDDWVSVAEAFPYLNLVATLMSGESCEESTPVVTFIVEDGVVEVMDGCLEMNSKFEVPILQRVSGKEIGLPLEWYEEFAAIIRSNLIQEKP